LLSVCISILLFGLAQGAFERTRSAGPSKKVNLCSFSAATAQPKTRELDGETKSFDFDLDFTSLTVWIRFVEFAPRRMNELPRGADALVQKALRTLLAVLQRQPHEWRDQ